MPKPPTEDKDKHLSLNRRAAPRWYFLVAIALLLIAAFFRLWNLGTTPPGMSEVELINAQLSERVRQGQVSIIYDESKPAREGLYYVLLAISTTITGRGLMLWRLPSVWVAMLSLAITARLVRRLFGIRVALMAMGLMAITFWSVWMGRIVEHVTLVPLVTTVAIYTLMRAFEATELTEASLWFTVGGLVLGAAQYVHMTAWTLLVLFGLFVAYYYVVDRQGLLKHRGNIVYTLLLAAILCLPLFIFLIRHPGVREPVPLAEQPGLITEIPSRLIASVAAMALRGDMLPTHNLPGRPVMGPVIAALMVIGFGVSIARWRRVPYGLALLWLAVGLLPTAFLPHNPDFEYMAVILPVIFVFPAIGLGAIFYFLRQRLENPARLLATYTIGSVVTLLIVVNATWTFLDYFLRWPQLGDVRLNYQADLGVLANYLDTSRDPTPISVCSTPVDRVGNPFALSNAELLSYLMHRRSLPVRYFDCRQSLVLAEGGDSQRIIFPRGHYYDHLPGPLLAWMRFAHDEQISGIRPDVILRIDVSEQLADQVGAFITTAPTAWPPESGEIRLADLPVSFGNNMAFLGYVVRDDKVQPGDWVELTTYWRMDGPPSAASVTLFAHLLGNPVVVIAQADSLGVQVETLQARDVFLQYSMIQTPGGMAPGLYPLSVGLYYTQNGERLPIFENGAPHADRLFLQRVSVGP